MTWSYTGADTGRQAGGSGLLKCRHHWTNALGCWDSHPSLDLPSVGQEQTKLHGFRWASISSAPQQPGILQWIREGSGLHLGL